MKRFIQYRPIVSEEAGPWRWKSSGMGYILQADNGHFVLIDGGMDKEDADRIVLLLEENSDQPIVDYWIITHPHADHYTAIMAFADNDELKQRVKVNAVVFNNPESFEERVDVPMQQMKLLPEKLGCRYIKPHSDDVLVANDMSFHFLFTWEDFPVEDSNSLSLMFDVTVSGGKRIMITGDAYGEVMHPVLKKYADHPEYFKCDVVQMAHHGLEDDCPQFYEAVGARIVLVPISLAGYGALQEGKLKSVDLKKAISIADEVIYACHGTREIVF